MFNNRIGYVLCLVLSGIITGSILTRAQTSGTTGPVMRLAATTANVAGAPDSVRFDVLSWSTDADRDQMLGAWNLTAAPAAGARGAAAGARGGGGARGERGGGARGDAPAAVPEANAPEAAAAPAGRGGRGGGRGAGAGGAADAARQTPQGALAAALQSARTVGYLWTSESAGYSLRYAYRLKQPDGGERIIFATDRRLGVWNDLWKPAGGAAVTDYDFSLIELRLNAKGEGEGKASITGKVSVDSSANTIALDGYSALPVIFKEVKRRAN